MFKIPTNEVPMKMGLHCKIIKHVNNREHGLAETINQNPQRLQIIGIIKYRLQECLICLKEG